MSRCDAVARGCKEGAYVANFRDHPEDYPTSEKGQGWVVTATRLAVPPIRLHDNAAECRFEIFGVPRVFEASTDVREDFLPLHLGASVASSGIPESGCGANSACH